MKSPDNFKTIRRMLTASAILVFGLTLFACGGGNSIAGSTLSQAQFDSLLKSSSLYASLTSSVTSQQTSVSSIQGKQTTDEATIGRIALFGHVPGVASTLAIAQGKLTGARTLGTDVVDTTDYGICSDMGQHVGTSFTDLDGSPTDIFKQCTLNEYVVNSETGAIANAPVIWFTSTDCSTGALEFEADGGYDRPTLQGGLIFKSPADGSVVWVQPLASGATPQQLTSQSTYTPGSGCVTTSETHIGYMAVANSTDGNTGSGVPSGGVPPNYVYN